MSDLISRQAAIDAILHITNCKSVRELFEYNQEHHLTEMWSGGVNDAIDAVIGVESATDKNVGTKDAEPEIIRCKDCKHWMPYEWMFSEVWRSKNMADYPEDEMGCKWCDMSMKANDFCSRADRREVTE